MLKRKNNNAIYVRKIFRAVNFQIDMQIDEKTRISFD